MTMQANGGQAPKSDCSEALSRLIDGELDHGGCRALFDRLSADAEARRTWVLLNVACDAVRSSETAALHSGGFVARVSAALATEPVILAPRAIRRYGTLRRVVVPVAAVAAAAVVLAVVAVPPLRGQRATPDEVVKVDPPVIPSGPVERSPRFEAYLEAHRESAIGPVTSPNEYITPATLTTESR
jgi:negative regulator of sigma E activity